MVAALFTSLAKTAKKLLTDYGKDITLTRTVNGSYDVATGGLSTTVTTHTVKGQLFDYDQRSQAQSGGLIAAGDRRVIIAASDISFEPNPSTDSLTVDGVLWKIIQVRKPVDEDIMYELQVRNVN